MPSVREASALQPVERRLVPLLHDRQLKETSVNKLIVTEGISGMWHYHLSDPKTFTRGLCGAQTMKTAIEAADFCKSFGDHFPKRPTWCAKCQQLATQQQPAVDVTAQ
jgi:hypothetical protein